MIVEAFTASLAGGLLWLDRFQFPQIMISRPICSAPIIGLLLGDLEIGLAVGVLFEMLWLRRLPVGGYIPPDITFAAIACTAIAALMRQTVWVELTSAAMLCFLGTLPLCVVGAKIDEALRSYLTRLASKAEDIPAPSSSSPGREIAKGLFCGLTFGFAGLFPIIVCGSTIVTELAPHVPKRLLTALGQAYFVIPLVGIMDLLVGVQDRKGYILFLAGFLTMLVIGFATGWIQTNL